MDKVNGIAPNVAANGDNVELSWLNRQRKVVEDEAALVCSNKQTVDLAKGPFDKRGCSC